MGKRPKTQKDVYYGDPGAPFLPMVRKGQESVVQTKFGLSVVITRGWPGTLSVPSRRMARPALMASASSLSAAAAAFLGLGHLPPLTTQPLPLALLSEVELSS